MLCSLVQFLGLCERQCVHLPETEEGRRIHLRKIRAALRASKGHGLTSGDPLQQALGRGQAEVAVG